MGMRCGCLAKVLHGLTRLSPPSSMEKKEGFPGAAIVDSVHLTTEG
jgi:hypothetical protein